MKKKTLYIYCILKLNVHEIKLNLHSKIANFNYKVQNCKLHQNEIFDALSLFWNRTTYSRSQPVSSLLAKAKQSPIVDLNQLLRYQVWNRLQLCYSPVHNLQMIDSHVYPSEHNTSGLLFSRLHLLDS